MYRSFISIKDLYIYKQVGNELSIRNLNLRAYQKVLKNLMSYTAKCIDMSEQFPKLFNAPVPGYVYVLAVLKILASPAPLRPYLASNNWDVPLVISAELS